MVNNPFILKMLKSESDWVIRQLPNDDLWIGLESPNSQGKLVCKIIKCRNHPMAHEINCCLLRCLSLILEITKGPIDIEAVKSAANMLNVPYEK